MTPPKGKEDMMLYITTTKNVVSTTIMVEREEPGHAYKMQRPVYYISEVLTESKVRYPHVQKLLYAVLISSRKLRHYFHEHKITVVTNFPLQDILRNRSDIKMGSRTRCSQPRLQTKNSNQISSIIRLHC
jgi:hypothetical protein